MPRVIPAAFFFMTFPTDLLPTVRDRIESPVCIPLGPPRLVARLVEAIDCSETVCWQLDLHQAAKLREELATLNVSAEVTATQDLWDIEQRFKTVGMITQRNACQDH